MSFRVESASEATANESMAGQVNRNWSPAGEISGENNDTDTRKEAEKINHATLEKKILDTRQS